MFGMTLSDDFNKLPSFGTNVSFTKREPLKRQPQPRPSSRQQQPRQSSEHLKAKRFDLAAALLASSDLEASEPQILNITGKPAQPSFSLSGSGGSFQHLLRPILYIDVNLAPGRPSERLPVFHGETPALIAEKFSLKHGLDYQMRIRLE